MKTKILKHRVPQRILIGMLLVLFCFTSKAQTWENVHFNVDWQMNVPLNSNFADKFSGWGMNFEGKYDLTPYWILCFTRTGNGYSSGALSTSGISCSRIL